MSSRIKVLVVDDAVVVRRLVADLLARDSGIEVVGTAATGRIALQKLTQLQPDVVTLDVDMPDMDGLETLRAIRKTHPALPVIMFSALTARAAAATLDALAFGASDYLCKPTALRADDALGMDLVGELALKIRALCGRGAASSSERRATPSNAAASPWRPGEFTSPVSVVAIGVSTGGPKALATIVPVRGRTAARS